MHPVCRAAVPGPIEGGSGQDVIDPLRKSRLYSLTAVQGRGGGGSGQNVIDPAKMMDKVKALGGVSASEHEAGRCFPPSLLNPPFAPPLPLRVRKYIFGVKRSLSFSVPLDSLCVRGHHFVHGCVRLPPSPFPYAVRGSLFRVHSYVDVH